MRKLRILHMTYASDAGGLSRYILELCEAMRPLGHQVAVAGDRGAWHGHFERAGIEWIELPYKSGPLGMITAWTRLRKWMKKNPVDLMHAHYRRPVVVGRMLQGFGGIGRIPILYTVHLSDLSLGWGRRWVSDFGDHTHVASAEAKRWVREVGRVAESRVSVIPHGVRTEQWTETTAEERQAARTKLGLGPCDIVAAFVGRLDQQHPKNCLWLVELGARWKQPEVKEPRVLKVLLVGEGPDHARLREAIDRQGLTDRVFLLGNRDTQGVLEVYQAADLLLLPSGREGFSLVCAEAMSTGLPVLRTRTAGTAELIVEGENGLSVPVEKEAFISAALALLPDQARLTAMRPHAARHIRQHLTFGRQLDATLALYERMTG